MKIMKKWMSYDDIFVKTNNDKFNYFWIWNDDYKYFQRIQYNDFIEWTYKLLNEYITSTHHDFNKMYDYIEDLIIKKEVILENYYN